MKKVIRISLILLMAICISGNVYAALKCNIDMKIEESEYNKGDTFTVHVNISNIESERGVISFGGTLKYDKDSLKLEKMEDLELLKVGLKKIEQKLESLKSKNIVRKIEYKK